MILNVVTLYFAHKLKILTLTFKVKINRVLLNFVAKYTKLNDPNFNDLFYITPTMLSDGQTEV